MAIIKAKSKKESKKEIVLSDSVWKDIDLYCKYAEIGGTIGAKRSSFVEAAAQLVFEQDADFQEFKRNYKEPVKAKKTPTAGADINEQQKKEKIKKEETQKHSTNRK